MVQNRTGMNRRELLVVMAKNIGEGSGRCVFEVKNEGVRSREFYCLPKRKAEEKYI